MHVLRGDNAKRATQERGPPSLRNGRFMISTVISHEAAHKELLYASSAAADYAPRCSCHLPCYSFQLCHNALTIR